MKISSGIPQMQYPHSNESTSTKRQTIKRSKRSIRKCGLRGRCTGHKSTFYLISYCVFFSAPFSNTLAALYGNVDGKSLQRPGRC